MNIVNHSSHISTFDSNNPSLNKKRMVLSKFDCSRNVNGMVGNIHSNLTLVKQSSVNQITR